MIELTLNNLTNNNCYEETLQVIEDICDDFGLENYFGNISMFNQMVIDYIMLYNQPFDLDVEFSILDDELVIKYFINPLDFTNLKNNQNNDNTIYFVMKKLSDNIDLSSDNKQLISTFHVKTNYKNLNKREKSIKAIESKRTNIVG